MNVCVRAPLASARTSLGLLEIAVLFLRRPALSQRRSGTLGA